MRCECAQAVCEKLAELIRWANRERARLGVVGHRLLVDRLTREMEIERRSAVPAPAGRKATVLKLPRAE